jgi:hypothetical protein
MGNRPQLKSFLVFTFTAYNIWVVTETDDKIVKILICAELR